MARPTAPQTVIRAAREVVCPGCGGRLFWSKRAQLVRRALAFLDLEWACPAADVYVCAQCRRILWYYRDDARLP